MSLESWLTFCATEAVLCLTPGPAVLFVVSTALARGGRSGMAGTLGILAANTLYFALAATGVAAAIVASGAVFGGMKLAGAAYLMALGVRALFSPAGAPSEVEHEPVPRPLARGFVVQAANPKALVFFVALLPQFIEPEPAVFDQVLILGLSSIVIELVVLATYVALAGRARAAAGARFATVLQRAGGVLLLAAGARLAQARGR